MRLHSERATAAIASSDAAARPMPARAIRVAPYRSTSAPAGIEASALAPK